jgi:hypothetical protein
LNCGFQKKIGASKSPTSFSRQTLVPMPKEKKGFKIQRQI